MTAIPPFHCRSGRRARSRRRSLACRFCSGGNRILDIPDPSRLARSSNL